MLPDVVSGALWVYAYGSYPPYYGYPDMENVLDMEIPTRD